MKTQDEIFYRELGNVQNLMEKPIDIITITGFMSWEEKLKHLQNYADEIGYKIKGLEELKQKTIFTEKELDILCNLLLYEQNQIHQQNGNIKPLLEDYRNELAKIYQKVVSCYED